MADNGLSDPYVLVVGAAGIDSKGRADAPLTLGSSTPVDYATAFAYPAERVHQGQ